MDLDGASALSLLTRLTGTFPSTTGPRKRELIESLPRLTEYDLSALDQKDACCPICFTPFLGILASEEIALAMESPAQSAEDLGVTRLAETCGHTFCRKDIATWIRQHDTCPTCRRPFFAMPTTSSDGEASRRNPNQDLADHFILLSASDAAPALWNEDWEMRQPVAPPAQEQDPTTQDSEGSRVGSSQPDDSERYEERNEFAGMYS